MSPNATVSAIQSLMRHLLDDPSGVASWVVQSSCTSKLGDYQPHVRASKLLSSQTTVLSEAEKAQMGTTVSRIEILCVLHLHVYESRDCPWLVVKEEVQWQQNGVKLGLECSCVVDPSPKLGFVDWARELHRASTDLLSRARALCATAEIANNLLAARLVEMPSPSKLEDEPTQDPDSEPLSSDPERVA